MHDEAVQPPLRDLTGRFNNEQPRHVLQHHRLQRKAAGQLSPLDERTPTQAVHGLEHLPRKPRCDEQDQQFLEAERLAHNGQPAQHGLLHGGEPANLLAEQLADTAETHRALLEEQADLPPEEVSDGLGHDLQGQRVARVHLGEPFPFLRSTHHLLLPKQLLTGVWL